VRRPGQGFYATFGTGELHRQSGDKIFTETMSEQISGLMPFFEAINN
jgi:hypothetical protein